MDRAFAVIAVATVLHLLAASASADADADAERQVVGFGWQTAASGTATTSNLALPPVGHHQRPTAADADEDAASMVGMRPPFAATHHLPAAPASWAHRPPLPWAGSEAQAGELGLAGLEVKELVRERPQPSYKGDGTMTTTSSQETSTGWLQAPAPGGSDVPAKTTDTGDEEGDLPELLNTDEPWLQHHCVVDRHDLNTGANLYIRMLYHFNLCLIKFSERRSSDHWVLCPEPSDPNDAPCGYVIVPQRGLDGLECALAFRADNLDIAAFANKRNKWHVFRRYAHLIPSAAVLDFDNEYKELIGEGDEAKMSIALGQGSMLHANTEISMYTKAPGIEERYVQFALGAMAINIAEAKRLTAVREVIVTGWLETTTLNEMLAKYLSRWRELSCALLVAEKGGAWGADEDSKKMIDLGIAKSKQDGLNIVDVLHDCSYQ